MMPILQPTRRQVLAGAAAASLAGPAGAQPREAIRIGVLADFTGPYRDTSGPTSVACVRQAIEDMQATVRGIPVEVVQADHQNRPDAALAIARRWFDQDGVDMVCEVNNSAIALAVANLAQEKNKVQLVTGAATSALTGEGCTANTIHWTYDTWMFANAVGGATVRAGGDTWFFITANYGFGHQMERDTSAFVSRAGGRVLGSVRFPLPGHDGLRLLPRAGAVERREDRRPRDRRGGHGELHQAGARVRADAPRPEARGHDHVHHGHPRHRAGGAQGLLLSEVFYWDLNDRTRAFMIASGRRRRTTGRTRSTPAPTPRRSTT
jgi:branched-chain amino acid transport system substrate-binding protein